MLQSIRNKTQSAGSIILLALIIFAFAIWGVDFQFGTSGPVVEVDGEEVSTSLIANAYNQQIQNYQQYFPNGIPAVQQEELKQSVIDQFVRKELLDQHAEKMGFRLSDQQVWEQIKSIPQFQVDGTFNAAQFEFFANRRNLTANGFFNEFRKSFVLSQMSNSFVETAFVTDEEARMRGELERESRTIRQLNLGMAQMLDRVEVEASAIEYEYELNQDQYMTDEQIRIDYIELDAAELAKSVEFVEQDLVDQYDLGVTSGLYASEEQRNSRHILIAANDERDESAALTLITSLRERILAGEDFAALATEYSDDTGSKPSGGELGWNAGEAFVGPFRDALFSMTADQITEPVKTRYGYHIIKLEGVRGNEDKPFSEVRDEIEANLRQELALDRLSELVTEVDEIVYDIDDSLTTAAEAAGVEVKQSGWFSRVGGVDIATYPQVRDAAFSTLVAEDGRNSSSINLDGKYVYLRRNDLRPSRLLTIDEVRPRIEARLKNKLASERTATQGSEIVERLRSGASLDDIAAELELTVIASKAIQRSDASISPAGREALFKAVKDSDALAFGGVSLGSGDYWIYELEQVSAGEALDDGQKEDYARAIANMEFAGYISGLRDKADVVLRPDNLPTL